jgi:hypothetical protein
VVLLVVTSVKFVDGAYLVVILIPIQVAIFLFIHRQYRASAAHLAIDSTVIVPQPHREERVVIPVPGLNRAVVQAVNVGRSMSDDVRAVFITRIRRGRAGARAMAAPGATGPDRRRRIAVPRARRAAHRLPRRSRPGLAA